jgi:hypothetical protein
MKNLHKIGKELFITSNEEIKDGDWYIHKQINYLRVSNSTAIPMDAKKIILTTDQDLIADGVQAIDDEFLEWFVKNPSCESIEVEDEGCQKWINPEELKPTKHKYIWISVYKIIIPQEEPKQEAQGYICPQTKKQCDDECCVSAEDCHIEQSIGVISDCEPDEEPCDNCDYCNNDICCCIIRTQETLEEFIFKVPFDYNIKPKKVIDMCMKEQENIILTFRLGSFIDMINSLSDDTEKNRILKSVFNNRDGELLLESYKSMKLHYEK